MSEQERPTEDEIREQHQQIIEMSQKIIEQLEQLEDQDHFPLDAQVVVESISDMIKEKKEEIKELRKLRKTMEPSLWRRFVYRVRGL